MKSLRIIVRRHGGPEVLETIEEEAPEPGRGEARVRVFAAGVSFAEMLMREGLHPEKTIPSIHAWMGHRGRGGKGRRGNIASMDRSDRCGSADPWRLRPAHLPSAD
jgi:NADPH:quinone reductase